MNGKQILKAWAATLPMSEKAQKNIVKIYTEKGIEWGRKA